MHQCLKEIQTTNNNVGFDKNSKGRILTIGNRASNLFYRLYDGKNFLKFEHEMKGKFLQDYHLLLVENRFEEFEQQLTSHFLSYSAKKLPLHYSYLDWLVIQIRPIRKLRKQPITESAIHSHYLDPNSFHAFTDRKHFFSLLQFLMYAQNLDFTADSLGTTSYRQVVFRLQDFFQYQNPTLKSTNYYQFKKIRDFFIQLQTNSLIQSFTDSEYRSLVTIPEVQLQKSKQNSWIAKVWIAEELFYYTHPFLLPTFFKTKTTKDQFEVQFKVIQVFSSINIELKFFIEMLVG